MVEPTKDVEHVEFTGDQFRSAAEKIARAVGSSGKKFNRVHGLPCGGLALAVYLKHRLEIPICLEDPLATVREMERLYRGADIDPNEVDWMIGGFISSTLIVDDLSDTGKQLSAFREKGFFIATIHKKPWTKVVPDIWIHEEKRWIDYPWEPWEWEAEMRRKTPA